jgi:hypothetical protein
MSAQETTRTCLTRDERPSWACAMGHGSVRRNKCDGASVAIQLWQDHWRLTDMHRATRVALSALISGTAASLMSTAALALLARAEGKGAIQPTNATSHWFHGDSAARHTDVDVAHTLAGYGTHHASALFWALPFQAWLEARPPRDGLELVRDASVMSAIAAAVDYGVVPRRVSPGWELVLSRRSLLATYGAVALGFAAGALIARGLLGDD